MPASSCLEALALRTFSHVNSICNTAYDSTIYLFLGTEFVSLTTCHSESRMDGVILVVKICDLKYY